MEFKGEAIEYTEKNSNHKAAKNSVSIRRLENWDKANWKYLNQQLSQ